MKIAVYLGSHAGSNPAYCQAAADLGDWIGSSRHTLVYGGAGVGMMTVLADHVLTQGGEVIGVMPRFMAAQGKAHPHLTQLMLTDTMAQRKAAMISLSNAFIALPGGPGTLEEISEVISLIRLQRLQAPCILLNIDGYYDALSQQFAQMIQAGFYTEQEFQRIAFAKDLPAAIQILSREIDRHG